MLTSCKWNIRVKHTWVSKDETNFALPVEMQLMKKCSDRCAMVTVSHSGTWQDGKRYVKRNLNYTETHPYRKKIFWSRRSNAKIVFNKIETVSGEHGTCSYRLGETMSELRPPAGLLFILQVIWSRSATAEWYWQGKTEYIGEKPVPVPLCTPQIPRGLNVARTRSSVVNKATVLAMARSNTKHILLAFIRCYWCRLHL
jgi:hypothetical protein